LKLPRKDPTKSMKNFIYYILKYINLLKFFHYIIFSFIAKTIVFDLDETLIHCNESTELPCDVILPIKFPTG
jgi:hypothetical protein